VKRKIASVALGVVLLGAGSAAAETRLDRPQTGPRVELKSKTVLRIPVSEKTVQYANEGLEEMLQWGPAGFTVAADGTFWLADTVGSRLVQFGRSGNQLKVIDLSDKARGITAVKVVGKDVFALEVASREPAILHAKVDGSFVGRTALPLRFPLEMTGLDADENGQLLIRRAGNSEYWSAAQLAGGDVSTLDNGIRPFSSQGRTFTSQASTQQVGPDSGRGYVAFGDRRIAIEVDNFLGGLRVLGALPNGSFYVVLEEVIISPQIQVDRTVRHYSASGELLGMARVPLDRYTAIENDLAIGPDGAVYAMVTRPDTVDIIQLSFSNWLKPVLVNLPTKQTESGDVGTKHCLRTRWAAVSDANAYVGLSTYLSSTNTDGYCAGRGKPRSIGGAGTYGGMPYDWGGDDTGASYKDHMSRGYQAGDINTGSIENCSRGLDCSGYVGKTWRLLDLTTAWHPMSTSSIDTYAFPLAAKSDLRAGDALNKAGSHMVLFDRLRDGGLDIYEETTTNSYDRTVYRWTGWSTWTYYSPWRYDHICD
jgi:hypothetical protein